MKTKKYLLFMLMALVSVAFVSCTEDDPEETCDSDEITDAYNCPTDVEIYATFCADGETNSYYTYDGVDYPCTSIDASACSKALDDIGLQLLEDHPECFTKKSGDTELAYLKLSNLAEGVLAEVRSKSLCE